MTTMFKVGPGDPAARARTPKPHRIVATRIAIGCEKDRNSKTRMMKISRIGAEQHLGQSQERLALDLVDAAILDLGPRRQLNLLGTAVAGSHPSRNPGRAPPAARSRLDRFRRFSRWISVWPSSISACAMLDKRDGWTGWRSEKQALDSFESWIGYAVGYRTRMPTSRSFADHV